MAAGLEYRGRDASGAVRERVAAAGGEIVVFAPMAAPPTPESAREAATPAAATGDATPAAEDRAKPPAASIATAVPSTADASGPATTPVTAADRAEPTLPVVATAAGPEAATDQEVTTKEPPTKIGGPDRSSAPRSLPVWRQPRRSPPSTAMTAALGSPPGRLPPGVPGPASDGRSNPSGNA